MRKIQYKSALVLAAGLLAFTGLSAQTAEEGITQQDLLMVLVTTMIVISLVALLLVFTILVIVRQRKEAMATSEEAVAETTAETGPARFSWAWINQKLTDAVPVAKESSIDMGHDYDGIRELDNNLPPWWKYGFYVSILFAVVYIGYYHVFNDWSSEQEYVVAMEEHEAIRADYFARMANMVNEQTVTVLTDASALSSGKELFEANCIACHGNDGGGNSIGPNLTDEYWIHGGSVNDVFTTIKYGVLEKGMQAWQDKLKPIQMQEVTSFILHELQGSTPAAPKDPQGELYIPEAAPIDSTTIAYNAQ